jgi:hypothetical protein
MVTSLDVRCGVGHPDAAFEEVADVIGDSEPHARHAQANAHGVTRDGVTEIRRSLHPARRASLGDAPARSITSRHRPRLAQPLYVADPCLRSRTSSFDSVRPSGLAAVLGARFSQEPVEQSDRSRLNSICQSDVAELVFPRPCFLPTRQPLSRYAPASVVHVHV